MKTLTLVPAYGRDYKSRKEVEAAFQEGKDFHVSDVGCPHNGAAANLPDIKDAGYEQVRIRYKRLTEVTVIKVV